jgi:hypothetical protein
VVIGESLGTAIASQRFAGSVISIAALACTMLGAVVAWIGPLHAPANAIVPGALLVGLVVDDARLQYARVWSMDDSGKLRRLEEGVM